MTTHKFIQYTVDRVDSVIFPRPAKRNRPELVFEAAFSTKEHEQLWEDVYHLLESFGWFTEN